MPVYHTPFFWTRLPEILSLHTRPPGLARKLLPRASFRARGGGLSAWMERAGQPGRPAAARSCCLRREQLDPTWTEAGLACYRRLRRALNQQSRSTRMPRARPFACLRMGAGTNSWPLRAKHERRARRAPGACRLGCGGEIVGARGPDGGALRGGRASTRARVGRLGVAGNQREEGDSALHPPSLRSLLLPLLFLKQPC